jgi:hypothetical protein
MYLNKPEAVSLSLLWLLNHPTFARAGKKSSALQFLKYTFIQTKP